MININKNSLKIIFVFSIAINCCFAVVAQAKGRALLIISELDARGVKELRPLYKGLEKLTWSIPSRMPLIDQIYFQQKLVTGIEASIEESQNSLIQMLRNPEIENLDLILGVHGLPDKIAFSDGSIETKTWVDSVKSKLNMNGDEIGLLKKLGFLYNLSCYGASHITSFLELGFQTVVGSRSVNANAEVEYPWVLQMLTLGSTVQAAFSKPNSDDWLNFADGPIRWLGRRQNSFLQETDSYKIIGGNTNYSILN